MSIRRSAPITSAVSSTMRIASTAASPFEPERSARSCANVSTGTTSLRVLRGRLEDRDRALDHLVVARDGDAEPARHLDELSGEHVDLVAREPIGELDVVLDGTPREEVERSLGRVEVVSERAERVDESIATPLERLDVHGEVVQVAERPLQDRAGDALPSERQLREPERLAHVPSIGHRRRERDVPDAFARREQLLPVRVDEERVGIELRRAAEYAVVEHDPRVRLVGDEVERSAVPFGRSRQDARETLEGLGWIDLSGW